MTQDPPTYLTLFEYETEARSGSHIPGTLRVGLGPIYALIGTCELGLIKHALTFPLDKEDCVKVTHALIDDPGGASYSVAGGPTRPVRLPNMGRVFLEPSRRLGLGV